MFLARQRASHVLQYPGMHTVGTHAWRLHRQQILQGHYNIHPRCGIKCPARFSEILLPYTSIRLSDSCKLHHTGICQTTRWHSLLPTSARSVFLCNLHKSIPLRSFYALCTAQLHCLRTAHALSILPVWRHAFAQQLVFFAVDAHLRVCRQTSCRLWL